MSIVYHDGFEACGCDVWKSSVRPNWKKRIWNVIKKVYYNMLFWRGIYQIGDKFRRRQDTWYMWKPTKKRWDICKPYNIPSRQAQYDEGIWIA